MDDDICRQCGKPATQRVAGIPVCTQFHAILWDLNRRVDRLIEMEDSNPTDDTAELRIDETRTDTLNVEEGHFEQVVQFIRSHNMPNAHMSVPRLVIETGDTSIEITAADDSVEIREMGDHD